MDASNDTADDDATSTCSADTTPTANTSSVSSVTTTSIDLTSPRAQIDSGAKATVTNTLSLLRDIKWYTKDFPSHVRMYGATNRNLIITPSAEGLLRIPANTKAGYIDVRCYYSHHFSSTLLSESDLILSTGTAGNYSGQSTTKYFDWDNDTIENQLSNGIIPHISHLHYYQNLI